MLPWLSAYLLLIYFIFFAAQIAELKGEALLSTNRPAHQTTNVFGLLEETGVPRQCRKDRQAPCTEIRGGTHSPESGGMSL